MEQWKRMKTAIVGCGMISNIYIRNLKHLFSVIDLAAVCDICETAGREKAECYGIERIMTLEEIEQSEEIELVVNLTGPAAHYEVIRRMLLAGKHVYTEKTMTTELAQAKELVALAEEKNLYLGVAPDTILGAGIQTAKKVLDAGMIGRMTSCQVSINRNQSLNAETFRFLRNSGGDLPHDVGIYYIAALLCLFGPVKRICAFGAPAGLHEACFLRQNELTDSWKIPGNNLLVGTLEFENGMLAGIHFNGNTVNVRRHQFAAYGTEGILELGDPNTFGGFVRLSRPEGESCELPLTHGYDGRPTLPDPTPYEAIYGNRGIGVAEMAWAIRGNRANRCSKELGLHALEVLTGLDTAAKTGEAYRMSTSFDPVAPLPSGYYSTMMDGKAAADAERSLI